MADRRKLGVGILAYVLMVVGFAFLLGGLSRRNVAVAAMGAFGVYWGLRFLRLARSGLPPAGGTDGDPQSDA